VLNRVRTIADAVESVMAQKTSFPFNLILVDNHSTDGTTGLIRKLSASFDKLIHIIPDRRDLGIGGCWNVAVHDPRCGKFAVQLDSDDLYAGEDTLEQMVGAFYDQKCAMVIGSYRMTNFELQEIPPGVIDHREWTLENGRNNALRINGLGAPRAFFTPLLRSIRIPNVSYGEDYGVGLAVSRHYRIGRIYKPLYLCRRWEDNSDASLGVEAMNRHHVYKDRLRSFEVQARINLNETA
jgi:glycosyltransferase involved in cell wall biosynthesis